MPPRNVSASATHKAPRGAGAARPGNGSARSLEQIRVGGEGERLLQTAGSGCTRKRVYRERPVLVRGHTAPEGPSASRRRASERGRVAARGGGGYVAIDMCLLAATLSLWLHCPRTDSRKNNDVYSRGEKGGEQEAMKLSTPHRVCRSPTSDPEKAGRPVSDRCTSLSLSSSAHGRTRFQRTRLHFLAPLCPAPSSMLKNC